MSKKIKKKVTSICVVLCITCVFTGCTTKNIDNVQKHDIKQTVGIMDFDHNEVIETEVVIKSDSEDKIEFSLDGVPEETESSCDSNQEK